MRKTMRDFMSQTGGDFKKAQTLMREARSRGEVATPTTPSLVPAGTKKTTQKVDNKNRTGLTGTRTNYNPYTKENVKINTDVAVNTGQYSMQNKQDLWNKRGNTGDFEMDAFYRGSDGSLQIKDSYIQNKARSAKDANAYFNAKQIAEYENRNLPKSTKEGFEKYKEAYGEVLKGGQEAPKVYSAVEDMEKRREDMGIDSIEAQLAEVEKNKADLQANTRKRVNYAGDKAVAMGVISGRVGQIERQGNERMDALNREANYLGNVYKTKMSVIQAYMNAGAGDYERAKKAYDDEYRRNVNLLSAYEKKTNNEYSQEREAKLDARANLQTMYNLVTSGAMNIDNMSESQKNTMGKLELQAGLPMGTMQQLRNMNPKADIISQNVVTDTNGKYLSVVMRGENGEFEVKRMKIGEASRSANRYQYKGDGVVFDSATGKVRSAPKEASVVHSAIQKCRTTGQCGAGVNDYLQKIGDTRVFGNAYSQKKSKINSRSPSVGSIAIWQPSGGQPKYGHVGIILDTKGDKVLIHDWNWGDDEKQRQHWVSNSVINKTGGYYIPRTNKKGSDKSQKINNNLRSDASVLIGKLGNGDIDFNTAHSQLFVKYGSQLKNLGYSDPQVKKAIHKLLGGK